MSRAKEARALYRALIRAAKFMPVENRKQLAISRIRHEFRKTSSLACKSWFIACLTCFCRRASKSETNDNNLNDLFLVGYTQLETLSIQVALSRNQIV